MGSQKASAIARANRLALHREKRWAGKPSDTTLHEESGGSPNPIQLSKHSISECNIEDSIPPHRILSESAKPTAAKPTNLDDHDPGVDPEDLPLEDPPAEEVFEEEPIGYDDGWWEQQQLVEENGPEEDCASRIDNQPIPANDRDRLICELDVIEKGSYRGKGKKRRSILDEFSLGRIRMMSAALRLLRELDSGLIKASYLAAVAIGRSKSAATSIRRWIREFWRTGNLPTNVHGRWNESIIEDEDLKLALQEHLRCTGRYASPKDVVDFFSTSEGKKFAHLFDKPPSIRTAQRWMPILGYHWKTERRGQFADGHEREDVVDYRMNHFIPEWEKYERRMRSWDREGNEILPDLKPGEKEVNVNWHDETIFKAHERRMTRWIPEWESPGLYKKGEGLSLMVSDIISPKYGWLRRPSDENDTARVLFRPGKERDGYFTGPDVCKQFGGVFKFLTEEYSHEEHLFIVDNATTHTRLPDDAPIPSRMTLGPSQKVKGEHVTSTGEKVPVNFAPGKFADGTPQNFYYPLNHRKKDLRGAFKGLAKILEERGIPNARKLKLHCPKTNGRTGCPADRKDCCARTIMANQPDIRAQKTSLQLLAESYGCTVLYLPKYHCELNPIEQCWALAKRVYRDSPMSSLEADLICNAVAALNAVTLQSIQRFVGRSRRFTHAYKSGLTCQQAAWANKRFHGHRVVTEAVLRLVDIPEPPELAIVHDFVV